MCGIVAASTPNHPVFPFLYDGLKKLEYRGYDSFGLAVKDGDYVASCKQVGRVQKSNVPEMGGCLGIGHTRWATHGDVSERNCHPIQVRRSPNSCFVVHNGIIENFEELNSDPKIRGCFRTQVDTEVLGLLFLREFEKCSSPLISCHRTICSIKGSSAFVILYDNCLLAGSKGGTPLYISSCSSYIASDLSAMPKGKTRKLLDGECISIHPQHKQADGHEQNLLYSTITDESLYEWFDFKCEDFKSSKRVKLTIEVEDLDESKNEKSPHKMLDEIFEQPDVILNGLEDFIFGDQVSENLTFLGCGSSYYAALLGARAFEEFPEFEVDVQHASEFRPKINSLLAYQWGVLALSQSGETKDVIDALNFYTTIKKENLGAITNSPQSSISRMVPYNVSTNVGHEDAVAATKTFTAQVVTLWRMALNNTRRDNSVLRLQEQINDLPNQIQNVLDRYTFDIQVAPHEYNHILLLGHSLHYPVALEGALKLKEVAYIHAEAMPAAEIKHGPIALIDDSVLTIALIDSPKSITPRIFQNMREVKARGGKVLAIVSEEVLPLMSHEVADSWIPAPGSSYTSAITMTVILQLLAYDAAVARGLDPDRPRNLAKSVTV